MGVKLNAQAPRPNVLDEHIDGVVPFNFTVLAMKKPNYSQSRKSCPFLDELYGLSSVHGGKCKPRLQHPEVVVGRHFTDFLLKSCLGAPSLCSLAPPCPLWAKSGPVQPVLVARRLRYYLAIRRNSEFGVQSNPC